MFLSSRIQHVHCTRSKSSHHVVHHRPCSVSQGPENVVLYSYDTALVRLCKVCNLLNIYSERQEGTKSGLHTAVFTYACERRTLHCTACCRGNLKNSNKFCGIFHNINNMSAAQFVRSAKLSSPNIHVKSLFQDIGNIMFGHCVHQQSLPVNSWMHTCDTERNKQCAGPSRPGQLWNPQLGFTCKLPQASLQSLAQCFRCSTAARQSRADSALALLSCRL